ncbi:Acid protease [Mycena chlorophos]|uniref:Acid protease n=1 Tax=Mycena chlorophos TaxID=658473 RepID=A0A8H6TED3_MYCCL|nr:Acid protease [Mycena chlorophos]
MQLSLSFSSLLAGVLVALTATTEVAAVPTPIQGRSVTLPLKRLEARNPNGLHPKILMQQHMNRAHKRLARMTGRTVPSDDVLYSALHKRVLDVEGAEGLERRLNRNTHGKPQNDKRFNRTGVSRVQSRNERRKNKKHKGAKGAAAGAAAGGAAAGAAAGGAADASNPAAVTNNANLGGPDSQTGVAVANAPTGNNSLGLNIEITDVGYLATIQMGTPPTNYLILMDSGSADLWVASEDCQSTGGGDCGQHQTLGSTSSSSFAASNTPFEVTYGTGAVQGAIIQDNIVVAGLQLTAHTFGVATQETTDFSDDSVPFDGLMGLAQSTLSQQQVLTPVESLAQQGLISDAITAYKISRTADDLNDGEISFGAPDASKFDASTLVTVPNVNTEGFWEAALDDVAVNGQSLNFQGRTSILDTGTTLMVIAQSDAEAIHQLIDGSADAGNGQFTVPCDTNATVAFTYGGKAFDIDPRDIAVQPPVDANNNCLSGITGGSVGTSATQFLVGDVFLKNAYYITDVGQNQISLAKLT